MAWDLDVRFSEFYAVYEELCKDAHAKPVGRNRIGKELQKYGLEAISKAGNVRYIRLPMPKVVLANLRQASRFDALVSPEQLEFIEEWNGPKDELSAVVSIAKSIEGKVKTHG